MAERIDDVAREPVDEDLARRADVERQPEQGQGEQHRREPRELRGILDVDDGEQDEQRQADVHGQQHVDQEGRDREDEQQDRAEEGKGEDQVGTG